MSYSKNTFFFEKAKKGKKKRKKSYCTDYKNLSKWDEEKIRGDLDSLYIFPSRHLNMNKNGAIHTELHCLDVKYKKVCQQLQ